MRPPGRGRGKGRTETKLQTTSAVQSIMESSEGKTCISRHVQTAAVSLDKKGTQTEQTIESLDCLELENCNMKNIKYQLESEIESLKIIHADELANVRKEIDEMKKKNDVLNKKLNLTTDVVKTNENLKRENVQLKEKLKSLDECQLVQEKWKSEIASLRDELEANKQALEEIGCLKEKQSNLEKDLEIADRTIEYMKVNLITEITESIVNNRKEDIDGLYPADQGFAHNVALNPLAEQQNIKKHGSVIKSNAQGQQFNAQGQQFNAQGQQFNANSNNRFRFDPNQQNYYLNEPSDRRLAPQKYSDQNDRRFIGNQNSYRRRYSNLNNAKNNRSYQQYYRQ